MAKYDHQKIEEKWQKIWAAKKMWKTDIKKAKKPYYNLMMFPYPSAEGLHVGNVYAFTGSDIHGRFRRMQGYDVFEPMGFDSFGIHSENFAIKKGTHPKVQTTKNIQNFRRQLKAMGALFDWDHEVITSKANYYKWTQWLFLQLYKAGLAYRAKAPVDWCPSCKTVLADEQVIDGKCERCGTEVIQKELEQWFFRITKYADRLLKNLGKIDWSERTKVAQRNWIGKSEGAELKFPISNFQFSIEVFTTRPDTLFGATYMVLAPEHHLVEQLKPQIINWEEVEKYRKDAAKKNELERTELAKEKTGMELKGVKAINPANNQEISIWISDYVLASYGTGAIMAVPAHDKRDWEFAKRYELEIRQVVLTAGSVAGYWSEKRQRYEVQKFEDEWNDHYINRGKLINSGQFDGMDSEKAKWEITKFVGGRRAAKYHLRDWLISRQRYWGPPIPIIYCDKCGTVPVPEKDLPVLLPNVKDFRPTGTDKSPLASVEKFVKAKCPKCKSLARRETDVSDTFLDSSWYFFRYPSTDFRNTPFDKLRVKRWLPVDMYIGGQEHAVLHLLYTRFITMVLKDAGLIDFEEPFKRFRAHGLLTKDGAKMSKSKGNVVNPDNYFKKYGADTVRMYLMFVGPFSEGGDWSDRGIVGIYRFLNRVWTFVQESKTRNSKHEIRNKSQTPNPKFETLRQRTIKKVTEDLENLRYNTAIASLMEYSNAISNQQSVIKISRRETISKKDVEALLILLAPFAPYITEELWQELQTKNYKLKTSVHNQRWPKYNSKLIQQETTRLILQVNGKVRDVVEASVGISEAEAKKLALESGKIKKWLAGKTPKKLIFVPGRLINIVL